MKIIIQMQIFNQNQGTIRLKSTKPKQLWIPSHTKNEKHDSWPPYRSWMKESINKYGTTIICSCNFMFALLLSLSHLPWFECELLISSLFTWPDQGRPGQPSWLEFLALSALITPMHYTASNTRIDNCFILFCFFWCKLFRQSAGIWFFTIRQTAHVALNMINFCLMMNFNFRKEVFSSFKLIENVFSGLLKHMLQWFPFLPLIIHFSASNNIYFTSFYSPVTCREWKSSLLDLKCKVVVN